MPLGCRDLLSSFRSYYTFCFHFTHLYYFLHGGLELLGASLLLLYSAFQIHSV